MGPKQKKKKNAMLHGILCVEGGVWQHCQYLYVHAMLHGILCVEGGVWQHCQYLYVHAVRCGTLNMTQ